MPKVKKSSTKTNKVDTVKCPFCIAQMLPEDLADHVTSVHPKGAETQTLTPRQDGKTIDDIKQERGIKSTLMLHGQDIPHGVSQITIKILELREAPRNFNSPFILDLDEPLPVAGRSSIAINITNLRSLATLCGLDPKICTIEQIIQQSRGRTFPMYIGMTNNPKERKMVRSLFFQQD